MHSKVQPLQHEGKACIVMRIKDGKHEESERIGMMRLHGVRENKENHNIIYLSKVKNISLVSAVNTVDPQVEALILINWVQSRVDLRDNFNA